RRISTTRVERPVGVETVDGADRVDDVEAAPAARHNEPSIPLNREAEHEARLGVVDDDPATCAEPQIGLAGRGNAVEERVRHRAARLRGVEGVHPATTTMTAAGLV